MKQEILNQLELKENHEYECKLAANGLPVSMWETYSSFANTDGGTIFLGIKEHRDSFTVEGLTEKQVIKYQKDFWSIVNDRHKVSKNTLLRGKRFLELMFRQQTGMITQCILVLIR